MTTSNGLRTSRSVWRTQWCRLLVLIGRVSLRAEGTASPAWCLSGVRRFRREALFQAHEEHHRDREVHHRGGEGEARQAYPQEEQDVEDQVEPCVQEAHR